MCRPGAAIDPYHGTQRRGLDASRRRYAESEPRRRLQGPTGRWGYARPDVSLDGPAHRSLP